MNKHCSLVLTHLKGFDDDDLFFVLGETLSKDNNKIKLIFKFPPSLKLLVAFRVNGFKSRFGFLLYFCFKGFSAYLGNKLLTLLNLRKSGIWISLALFFLSFRQTLQSGHFRSLGLQRPVEQHTSVLQAIEAESLVSQVPFSQAQDVTPVVLESTPGPSEGTLPRPESSSLIPGLTTQPASMAPQISGGTSKTTVVVPQVTGVTSHMAGQTSKTSVVVSQVPSVTSHVPGLVSKASIMTSQKTGAVSQASSGTKSGLSSQTGLTTQVSGATPQKSAMPYTSSVTLQSSIVTSQITGVTSQSTGAISETTDVRSQASHLTSQPVGLPSELVLQSVHSTSAIPEQVDLQEVPSSTTDGPPASAEVRGTTPSTVASSAVTSSMTPGMVREELLEEMVVSDGIMNLEQHEASVSIWTVVENVLDIEG